MKGLIAILPQFHNGQSTTYTIFFMDLMAFENYYKFFQLSLDWKERGFGDF